MQYPPHFCLLVQGGSPMSVIPGAAGDVYEHELFKLGKEISECTGIPYYILSSMMGFLRPQTPISYYERPLLRKYGGDFPPEPWHGFHVGGERFFGNAPLRFERLVPKTDLNRTAIALRKLLQDPDKLNTMINEHLKRYPE